VRGCTIGAAGSLNSGPDLLPRTGEGDAGSSAPRLRARLEEPDQLHDVVRRDPPDRSGAVGGMQHAAVGPEQELARLDEVALGLETIHRSAPSTSSAPGSAPRPPSRAD